MNFSYQIIKLLIRETFAPKRSEDQRELRYQRKIKEGVPAPAVLFKSQSGCPSWTIGRTFKLKVWIGPAGRGKPYSLRAKAA